MKRADSEQSRFEQAVVSLLAIPKAELDRRETEYKKRSNANPRKRGPKRKVNPSASHDPVGGED